MSATTGSSHPAGAHERRRRASRSSWSRSCSDASCSARRRSSFYESVQEFRVAEDDDGDAHRLRRAARHVERPRRGAHARGRRRVARQGRRPRAAATGSRTDARELGLSRLFCLTFEVGFFAAHGFVDMGDETVDPAGLRRARALARRGCRRVPRPRAGEAEHARQHPHAEAVSERCLSAARTAAAACRGYPAGMSTFKHPVGPQPSKRVLAPPAASSLSACSPSSSSSSSSSCAPARRTATPAPTAGDAGADEHAATSRARASRPAATTADGAAVQAGGRDGRGGHGQGHLCGRRTAAALGRRSRTPGRRRARSTPARRSRCSRSPAAPRSTGSRPTARATRWMRRCCCSRARRSRRRRRSPGTAPGPTRRRVRRTATQVPAAGASYHLETSVAGIKSSETKQFILQ